MSKIRVAHFFKRMDYGGAELRTIQLMEHLACSVTPTFVVSSRKVGLLEDRVKDMGGEIYRLPFGLFYGLHLWRFLKRNQIQVIHSHVALFSGFINFIGFLASIPVRIAHFRSDGIAKNISRSRRCLRWAERLFVDLFSTHIVGVSPGSLTYGYRSNWERRKKAQVIPNGFVFPTAAAKRLRHGALDAALIHVGRANPAKRREFLGSVTNELIRRGVRAELTFVGQEGADTDAAESVARRAGNAGAVRSVGVVADPFEMLAASDLLLLPSNREGLPGVVLEALSVGTKVVASDLPGVRYIASYCRGITIVPVDSSAEDWAKAIISALRSPMPPSLLMDDVRHSPFDIENVGSLVLSLYRDAR